MFLKILHISNIKDSIGCICIVECICVCTRMCVYNNNNHRKGCYEFETSREGHEGNKEGSIQEKLEGIKGK